MNDVIRNRIAIDNEKEFIRILTVGWRDIWPPFRMVYHVLFAGVILVSAALAAHNAGNGHYIFLGVAAVLLLHLVGEVAMYATLKGKLLGSAEMRYYALWELRLAANEMTEDERRQFQTGRDLFNCAFQDAKWHHPWPFLRLWPQAQQEWMRALFFTALDRHAHFVAHIEDNPATVAT